MDVADDVVIKKVQAGDIEQFQILVHRYSSKVQAFIGSRCRDAFLVDDVVQTAFIQFYKSITRFDTTRPVLPYLFQIAKNELYMYYRRHKGAVTLDERVQVVTPTQDTADDMDVVQGALKDLKKDQKQALLWFAEGYKYEEIASKMQKPINTVRTLIRRARLYIQHQVTHEH